MHAYFENKFPFKKSSRVKNTFYYSFKNEEQYILLSELPIWILFQRKTLNIRKKNEIGRKERFTQTLVSYIFKSGWTLGLVSLGLHSKMAVSVSHIKPLLLMVFLPVSRITQKWKYLFIFCPSRKHCFSAFLHLRIKI